MKLHQLMKMRVSGRGILFIDDKVVLLYRERVVNGKRLTYYAIPGGMLEDNETIEECVKREFKEELNIDTEIIKYLGDITDGDNLNKMFYLNYVSGNIELGGEEKEHNNKDNYYEVRLLPISEINNSPLIKDINKDYINRCYKERK